jgi:hypothetical protein
VSESFTVFFRDGHQVANHPEFAGFRSWHAKCSDYTATCLPGDISTRSISMWIRDDHINLTTTIAPPAGVAFGFYLLSLLPSEILVALTAWTLASFPIGVLIGHFILNEE